MSDLTGAPYIRDTDLNAKEDDELWQMVKGYDVQDYMMNA